jgi:CheY-like chemotaxis protein
LGSASAVTLDTVLLSGQGDRARHIPPRGRVVIVNGYVDGREMYVDYLRFCGFLVDAASDPIEALRLVRLHPPNVIVTDFVFPTGRIDGPDFITRVRETVNDSHLCIIVVSGFTRPTDRRRARRAGADRFLLKPCLPHELLREVERAIALTSCDNSGRGWPSQHGPR